MLMMWLSLFFVGALWATEYDRNEIPRQAKKSIEKIINAYGSGFKGIAKNHLQKLEKVSKESYKIWADVYRYWEWIENSMIENIGVAPDGIENPAEHAFIVLGFALNNDGTMKEELVGRLEVARASWEKYPESYLLVTGGVEKKGWTEGRRMKDWLVAKGVLESKIIIEEAAPDTAGNATNSFEILYKNYEIKSVSLITSQYHLKRGSLLYYAESLLKAKELGVEPINFLGNANAGWKINNKNAESLSLKAWSLKLVAFNE